MLRIKFMSASCEISLRLMPQNTFDDKSTLVQVMASVVRQQTTARAIIGPDLCIHI